MNKYLKISGILIAVLIGFGGFLYTPKTEAARIHSFGWEMATTTAGVEHSAAGLGGGWGSIDTTTVHGGTYSFKNKPTIAAFSWLGHVFRTAGSSKASVRCYFNVFIVTATNPIEVCSFWNSVAVDREASVVLTSGGVLQLLQDNDTQIGSNSTAIATGTWYMVDLTAEGTGAADNDIEGRLNGVSFASSATATVGNFDAVYLGTPNASAVYEIYMDDIAINDTSGSAQTSYPGEGKLVLLPPDAAGDNLPDAGTFASVNRIPYTSSVATTTDRIDLDTNTSVASFNVSSSASRGIDSYDTVTLVHGIARVREEAAGTSNWQMFIKSASGGTTASSSVPDAGDATLRTNPSSTTAFTANVISYTDPTTGITWTPTGTNSLDNLQIGALTTDGTPDVWLNGLYAMVEYVDGTAPPAPSSAKKKVIIMTED